MSNITSSAACWPTADESFGPVIRDCRGGFDFTIAFEQYLFSILPASLLIIAGPLRLKYLSKSPSVVAGHAFKFAKLAAVGLFAALQLSLLAVWATQPEALGRVKTVSVAASCVSFVASLIFCALTYAEHARSLRPSSILNAYLLISLLLDGAILRTFWLSDLATSVRAVFTASFALKACLLVLEAKEKAGLIIGNDRQSNPEVTSGLYSRGLFSWLNPLLLDGFRRLLKPADLYALDKSMKAAVLNDRFWVTWNKVKPNSNNRLLVSCIRTLKWPLMGAIFPRLLELAFTICQPLVLNQFLTFLEDPTESINHGYGLIGAYGLVYLGIALSSAFFSHQATRTLTMLRGILVSAIFACSTQLSTTAIDNAAAVTLMSTDVDAIIRATREILEMWANILQIVIATYLLSRQIGAAFVGPIIVSAVSLVATVLCGPPSKKFMMAWITKVQERVGITSTMLGHMKSIKMSGLGQRIGDTIAKLRKDEIDAAAPFRRMNAVTSALAQVPLLISPVVAFAFFAIGTVNSGESLQATRMFSSLSLIILLGQPLFWMFEAVLDINAGAGCFKRIEKFLSTASKADKRADAMPTSPRSYEYGLEGSTTQLSPRLPEGLELEDLVLAQQNGAEPQGVRVEDACFRWSPEDAAVLKDVRLMVNREELAIIVGSVASGKTTLLKGLLGEVPHVTGRVSLQRHRVSWCDQSPWLTNDSIRKNIVGFSEYEEDLYRLVTHACDLEKDFASLEDGDLTVIGSNGIALSGGQKQRVALARAVYSRPQLALFDDPFSGLDNHTTRVVFSRIFGKDTGLLRQWGTTVVLATQAVKLLPFSDRVIVLRDGIVAEQGKFASLSKTGGHLASLNDQDESAHSSDDEAESSAAPSHSGPVQEAIPKVPRPSQAQPEDKRRQRGDSAVYGFFIKTIGMPFAMGLLVSEIAWAFLSNFSTVWLNFWSEANAEHPNQRIGYYLGVFTALQILGVVSFGLVAMFGMLFVASRTGMRLHQVLLDAVVRAPLSLFTSTDIGSITTRFSQDIGIIDRSLPLALLVTIANLLSTIGIAALIASSTGYIAISFPFLVAVFVYIQRGYLRTSRQLRLLDLEQKAPVYTQFLETLSGLLTIRAFGWAKSVLELNHDLVDKSQQPFYLLLMVQQWLTLVLNLVTAALAVLIVGLAVRLRDSVSVGLTAVSLIQLINLAENLKILIQFWTSLETSIGAVARIKNFSEETPDERLPGENQQPPQNWPENGKIEIRDLSVSYGEDLEHKALDGVTLTIRAGEKIGICGRTGSGKSTLLLSLLRLLPSTSGTIHVDGADLATLPRDKVRSRLIAVSQDLFFLPGTILQNLDPYGNAGTSAGPPVEAVLRRVGLWEPVAAAGGLGAKFDEDKFSHGQRQLFSLARALLRRDSGIGGKVVLFDEATSSVDAETDALVQRIVREDFGSHTVMSIAHRLETIVDFDRVVVLEKGCIVEEGCPRDLLAQPGASRFRELWDASRRAGRVD
ncbi:multidrug resistance-like protein [Diaporthe amygdali]|uniref:multidrug resistance-like protein n=1 Tax=Phomopsis amygdali TaxID=1214568 RepID=UPI0022FF060A|nr:multidrug resistance-like protein [Diaporthe amygdali]KAJ0117931.1 multidrug resistance-like protein [Diaporthe amygdali]